MTPLRGGGEPHKAETASHAQRGRLLITAHACSRVTMKGNYNTHKEKTVSAHIERPFYIHAVICS